MFCKCGCGQTTRLSDRTDLARSVTKGQPIHYISGHHRRRPIEERFWEKVDKNGPDGCWLWIGAQSRGYGRVAWRGRQEACHRLSYILLVGPIPIGLELDHLCRVPSCVNPEHLEAVSHRENMHRGYNIGAVNAQKKCCLKGHIFDLFNTRIKTTGHRECKACARDRRYTYRKKS